MGQLGLGDGFSRASSQDTVVNLGAGRTVLKVVSGKLHTCALLDGNEIKCWGECHVPPCPWRWPGSTLERAGPAYALAADICV